MYFVVLKPPFGVGEAPFQQYIILGARLQGQAADGGFRAS